MTFLTCGLWVTGDTIIHKEWKHWIIQYPPPKKKDYSFKNVGNKAFLILHNIMVIVRKTCQLMLKHKGGISYNEPHQLIETHSSKFTRMPDNVIFTWLPEHLK